MLFRSPALFYLSENLPASTYFLSANNIAVIVIASLYREDRTAFMRRISDYTILLASVLFVSFGLIAFYTN